MNLRAHLLLLVAIVASVYAVSPVSASVCRPDALGTSRVVKIGAATAPLGLKTYPRTLALAPGEVALTFDDGPSTRTTPRILAALANECVKATFFLIGQNAAANPTLVREEVAAGHTLGSHTFSHPARTLRRMDERAAEDDIERGFKALDLAAYGETAGAPRTPFFRFPGFADTPWLDAWLAMRGVTVFGADLWASDWLPLKPDAERQLVLDRLRKMHGGILLLHDTKEATATMLPQLLRDLKTEGYRIVALVPGDSATDVRPAGPSWRSETDASFARTYGRLAYRRATR